MAIQNKVEKLVNRNLHTYYGNYGFEKPLGCIPRVMVGPRQVVVKFGLNGDKHLYLWNDYGGAKELTVAIIRKLNKLYYGCDRLAEALIS